MRRGCAQGKRGRRRRREESSIECFVSTMKLKDKKVGGSTLSYRGVISERDLSPREIFPPEGDIKKSRPVETLEPNPPLRQPPGATKRRIKAGGQVVLFLSYLGPGTPMGTRTKNGDSKAHDKRMTHSDETPSPRDWTPRPWCGRRRPNDTYPRKVVETLLLCPKGTWCVRCRFGRRKWTAGPYPPDLNLLPPPTQSPEPTTGRPLGCLEVTGGLKRVASNKEGTKEARL